MLDESGGFQKSHVKPAGGFDRPTQPRFAVLLEGQRINVTDHGSLRHLRDDARQLADFIGVPLWDAA